MKENEWISVEDGLPQIPEPYFDNECGGMVYPANINVIVFDGEDVYEKSFGIIEWDKSITHWMYLPAPPQPNKK